MAGYATKSLKDVTVELLLSEAIAKPLERQTRGDQTAVGNVLKSLGYSKGPKKCINGCRNQSTFETLLIKQLDMVGRTLDIASVRSPDCHKASTYVNLRPTYFCSKSP